MSAHTPIGVAVRKIFSPREKMADNSSESINELLQPIKTHLYNFVYKALNFSEDADDVFQDTVMRAIKYFPSFKPEKSFKTWIFTIAHNEIKAYYKKRHINEPTRQIEEIEGICITGNEGEQQQVRDIYDIASKLNPRERKVFFLFYDQHFSIEEIETVTRLRQGNIKFILNRSRQKIKDKLGLIKEERT